jgi:hypothetical protein
MGTVVVVAMAMIDFVRLSMSRVGVHLDQNSRCHCLGGKSEL